MEDSEDFLMSGVVENTLDTPRSQLSVRGSLGGEI